MLGSNARVYATAAIAAVTAIVACAPAVGLSPTSTLVDALEPIPVGPAVVGLMETFELAVGASADVEGLGRVTFEAVTNDSRCAVICIRAGEAIVELSLEKEDRRVTLAVPPERPGGDIDLGPRYTLQALGIRPAPESTVRIASEEYRLRATVTDRGGVATPG